MLLKHAVGLLDTLRGPHTHAAETPRKTLGILNTLQRVPERRTDCHNGIKKGKLQKLTRENPCERLYRAPYPLHQERFGGRGKLI